MILRLCGNMSNIFKTDSNLICRQTH